jgi:hypothetical protein
LKFLLILFVMALALAPLAHFLPGKRQRKIARLREYAAVHGLFVEFRDIPGKSPAQARAGDPIYYGKRLPASVGGNVENGAWTRSGGDWTGVHTRRPVPSQLRELSVEILAGSVDKSSCGVYWTESGEEDCVEQIRRALEGWAADLAG